MDFIPTKITRSAYLDVIEQVVDAYGTDLLERQLALEDSAYHCTAFRTCLMLAYLIESGRRPELLPLWQKVSEKSIRALEASRNSAYNDLTLVDLCESFLLLREHVPARWLAVLRGIEPQTHYRFQPNDSTNNMMAYGVVGMYLREKLTGASSQDHLDTFLPLLLDCMDKNGMYDDKDHAMLYDLTVRVHLEQLLWYGYDGSWANQLEQILCCGAEMSLRMQSAAFQIPYGGRSNQFLHNEALQASLFEYAANRWNRRGDPQKAGAYKRAARLSLQTLQQYLALPSGGKHIRNRFPQDSIYGIDPYGTFPRYMNALATFMGCGYLACDDSIAEVPCPAEQGGYVMSTSACFGKLFSNAAGQSVEYAILADPKHEPAGLGRYHKAGIPAELGLSMPFVECPSYRLSRERIPFDILGTAPLTDGYADAVPSRTTAISAGIVDKTGNRTLLCQQESPLGWTVLEEQPQQVSFRVDWPSGAETVTLDEEGLHLSFCLNDSKSGSAFWAVPLLTDNGGELTRITIEDTLATVRMADGIYTVRSEVPLFLSDAICSNRNGIYRLLYADSASDQCQILLKLKRL